MYTYVLIYKKPNGQLLYRAVDTIGTKEIGSINSYGWELIGKQRMIGGKCISQSEYDTLLRRRRKKGRVLDFIKNFFEKIDLTELVKWGFVGYMFIHLCQ